MSVADNEIPAVGVRIIFERKSDVGNPYVRFDEQEFGSVVMVEI